MRPVTAWAKCVGGEPSTDWSCLLASLKRSKELALSDKANAPACPGLLFVPAPSEKLWDELESLCGEGSSPIIVVSRRRADIGGSPWRLFEAGASDLVVMEECEDPTACILARLERIADIEEIIGAKVVQENLVGKSASWGVVLRQVVEVARFSSTPLLITGESGTGKELVARLVHTLDTRPDKGALVILDCTTVSPELAGSEFFGHERGSFTNAHAARDGVFALANGGTLFLDEVGELPRGLQAELLRAVQEGTYKRVGSNTWQKATFRLVCATNRDLKAEEAQGNFRRDFYHRIACSHCHLPSLRERREDILPLARHFLRAASPGTVGLDFDPAVQEFLLMRDYPGNVRELGQLVRRIALRHVGPGPITPGAVPPEDRAPVLEKRKQDWRDGAFEHALRQALAGGAGLQTIREQTVESVVEIALRDAAGNVHRAAAKLGVTDRALQMRRAAKLDMVRANGNGRLTRLPESASPTDHGAGPSADQQQGL